MTDPTTIADLCRRFGLPLGDAYTQDWVQEVPEAWRTPVWLDRYLSALESDALDAAAIGGLLALALDVSNDLLEAGQLVERAWARLSQQLVRWPAIARPLVADWALEGEPLEDCFALTGLVRAIEWG